MVVTSLTFGNPLKFCLVSCYNAKGSPNFLYREGEHLKLRTNNTIYNERGLQWAPRAQELLPRRVVEQRYGGDGLFCLAGRGWVWTTADRFLPSERPNVQQRAPPTLVPRGRKRPRNASQLERPEDAPPRTPPAPTTTAMTI